MVASANKKYKFFASSNNFSAASFYKRMEVKIILVIKQVFSLIPAID
jgi:hypothetical protein